MVLIVEDEPLVRMMVIELFEDEGFEVLEAANADQALGIFGERGDVALLFTDVEMPGSLDGYALARWVHVHRPAVKTMIVSGRAMPRAGDVPDGRSLRGQALRPRRRDAPRSDHDGGLAVALPDTRVRS